MSTLSIYGLKMYAGVRCGEYYELTR